ncbi:MAG: type IV pili methyl-accepting chemotaxis transducer N-terminal domain-containing protein [Sulfitobacter sp.]
MTGQTISPRKNAENKIKLADRQRLLSEQMGRSICLVMGQIDAGSESDKARGSADVFDSTMQALRTGDENMGLLAEDNAEILAALENVQAISRTYRAATLQVGAGDLHSVPVSQILRLSDPLLAQSNALLATIEAVYGDGIGTGYAKTIELARRQTMLTQKLAKEICFVNLKVDHATMLARLSRTVDEFEQAQNALEQGGVAQGIKKPTPKSAKKLVAVRVLWDQFALLARSVEAGKTLSSAELEAMVDLSNRILFKCKQAARSYS